MGNAIPSTDFSEIKIDSARVLLSIYRERTEYDIERIGFKEYDIEHGKHNEMTLNTEN